MKGELGCVPEVRMPGVAASGMNKGPVRAPEDHLTEGRGRTPNGTRVAVARRAVQCTQSGMHADWAILCIIPPVEGMIGAHHWLK